MEETSAPKDCQSEETHVPEQWPSVKCYCSTVECARHMTRSHLLKLNWEYCVFAM